MLTNEKLTVMHRFFETLASQVRRVYQYANKEAETWLRAVMSPMEMQISEHQLQLRRRLESIKRIIKYLSDNGVIARDVTADLSQAYTYEFLSRATGKSAVELGQHQ